jgi:Protein of unknown function (DUF2795)
LKEELARHAKRNSGDRELVDALRSMNKDSGSWLPLVPPSASTAASSFHAQPPR